MEPAGCPLVPSSSLPPLRVLDSLTEDQIFASLTNLAALYCPLTTSFAYTLDHKNNHEKVSSEASDLDLVDSGYTSATEDDESSPESIQQRLAALRADDYERSFTERWLTRFIARAAELPSLSLEETMERAIDQASHILESFYTTPTDDDQGDQGFTREFSFEMSHSALEPAKTKPTVTVHLNDGLSGRDSKDPDDVGLQSWGASIILSTLLCAEPARFNLTRAALGPSPRIVELGAGTGLISLVLGSLLPHQAIPSATVIATDYHPAVLANLSANISANFPPPLTSSSSTRSKPPVETALLDWSSPSLVPPLDKQADTLIATDVVYGPEHAAWLNDCAARLLAPKGVFWLFVTVRQSRSFNGVIDAVESAFSAEDRRGGRDGRRLTILGAEEHGLTRGVGRGDESGYKLFRIGWAQVG
ncbi:hypothetical protein ACHAQH_007194 [Verticillium albo-atrum]